MACPTNYYACPLPTYHVFRIFVGIFCIRFIVFHICINNLLLTVVCNIVFVVFPYSNKSPRLVYEQGRNGSHVATLGLLLMLSMFLIKPQVLLSDSPSSE